MNRVEFLTELERLLADMPDDERQAAVQYYADYFADAGQEKEADVIRELGSPEKVAESIRADYYGAESGKADVGQNSLMEKKRPWTSNTLKLILIIVIAVMLWPLTLGIGLTVLAVAAAIVCFFAGLVIAAVAVMISGIVASAAGIIAAFSVPPVAMVSLGIGILMFVVGLITTVGTVKLCCIVYPAMLRGFVNLCRRPFYGKAV